MCACARSRVSAACCGCASYMRWVTDPRTHQHERWYSHLLLIIAAHGCSCCQLAHRANRASCQAVLHVRGSRAHAIASLSHESAAQSPRRPRSARQIHEPDPLAVLSGVESMGLQYQPFEGVLVVGGATARYQGTNLATLDHVGSVPVTSVFSIRLSSLEPGECTDSEHE